MISRPFNDTERQRFRNLLLLAAESPFEGERINAIAAASRLAARHGMSLREAARNDPPPPAETEPSQKPTAARWRMDRDMAAYVHMSEHFIRVDKERRERAMEEALRRGLDAEERRAAEQTPFRRPTMGRSKRNPESHARVLLRETSLPLQEIADLSGLDIYKVVGMKLKMRMTA